MATNRDKSKSIQTSKSNQPDLRPLVISTILCITVRVLFPVQVHFINKEVMALTFYTLCLGVNLPLYISAIVKLN